MAANTRVLLGLPVLAAVPFAASAADVSREQRNHRLLLAAAGTALLVGAATAWALKLWKFVA